MTGPFTSNFLGEGLVCGALSLQTSFGEGISMSALPSQTFLVTVKYVGPFHNKTWRMNSCNSVLYRRIVSHPSDT